MFQFPLNPIVGQTFNPVAGVNYRWNGTAWFNISTVAVGPGNFTDLTVTGNTTLGDAAADTLTVNAGTVTINQALGQITALADVKGIFHNVTFSGDPGGASVFYGYNSIITTSGANNVNTLNNLRLEREHAGSGVVTSLFGIVTSLRVSGTGNVTNATAHRAATAGYTGTGRVLAANGFQVQNLGHATLVDNVVCFRAEDQTASVVNVVGFRGNLTAGVGKFNLYMIGNAQNYLQGLTGIGAVPAAAGENLRIGGAITGLVSSYVTRALGTVQSDVTSSATTFASQVGTAAAAFVLGNLIHFSASPAAFGAGSVVTAQYGFLAESTLTGAGTNFGFYGNLAASGLTRYNLYMGGTAPNHLLGITGIGILPSATTALIVPAGIAGVAPFRIPHGVAPAAPVNGDIWTTTAGIFVRVNGATVGPLT